MRRRLLAVVLALILVTAGCSALPGTGTTTTTPSTTAPTDTTTTTATEATTTTATTSGPGDGTGDGRATEVKTGALAAMAAAETYRAAGTLNQSLESARGVQRLDVSVEAAFDRPADRFRTNQTVSLAGQRVEVSQYFVDGTLYQYSPINRQQYGSAWIRLNLSTNASAFFDAADTLGRQRAVLNVSTVELNGTATVDGVEAYVLDADATNATLAALGSVGTPDAGLNVSSLSGRFYVARDDSRLLRSVVTLNASVTQQGTTVDVTQTADLRFFDYGTDVSIVLPPGAEDAVRPDSEGGTF